MIMRVVLQSQNPHIVKKNREVLLVTSQETGLEVNLAKIKYVFMSCVQTVGPGHNIQVGKKIFESVPEFRYLRKALIS